MKENTLIKWAEYSACFAEVKGFEPSYEQIRGVVKQWRRSGQKNFLDYVLRIHNMGKNGKTFMAHDNRAHVDKFIRRENRKGERESRHIKKASELDMPVEEYKRIAASRVNQFSREDIRAKWHVKKAEEQDRMRNMREATKNKHDAHVQDYVKERQRKRSLARHHMMYGVDLDYTLRKRFSIRARQMLTKSLSGFKYESSKLRELGITQDELTRHLMSTLPSGATEDDVLSGRVHIDHIKPCVAFDLTDASQFKECFSLSNMQLMWADENWAKNSRHEGVLIRKRKAA